MQKYLLSNLEIQKHSVYFNLNSWSGFSFVCTKSKAIAKTKISGDITILSTSYSPKSSIVSYMLAALTLGHLTEC